MGNCTDSSDSISPTNNNNNSNQQPANTQQPNTTNTANTANTTKPTTTTPANTQQNNTTKPTTTTPVVNNTVVTGKFSAKAQAELAKHNQYRVKHHANPVVLSEWLCKGAQAWADHLAKNNKFEHSQANIDGKGVG